MGPSFHHNEVTVSVAGSGFDDGSGAATGDYAAWRDSALDGDRPAVLVQEHGVDREAHAEGVDRAAARK
jgi:hypothetical protein